VQNFENLKILIVDDDEDVRTFIADSFAEAGFHVSMAKSGFEALSLCEKNNFKFDIIITDIRMPDGSGIELLDTIRAKLQGDEAPVIMCISGFTDLSVESAYHKGADAFFVKPIDPDALIAAAKHFYNLRKQGAQAAINNSKKSA